MSDYPSIVARLKEDTSFYTSAEDYTVLYNTADEINAKRILEIGTNQGVSAIILATVAGKYGGGVQTIDYQIQPDLIDNLKRYDVHPYVQVLHKSSPWVDPRKIAYPLDYLFIDGNHYFQWVIADFHYFHIFVRPGGRIAFHDAYSGGDNQVYPAIEWIKRSTEDVMFNEVANVIGDKGIIVFEKLYDHDELVKTILRDY